MPFAKSSSLLRRAFALLVPATLAVGLGGCYSEGGLGWSEDQYVYVSHEYQPWTITLVDTRTATNFWTVDVPVGQQLVIHFVPGENAQSSYTPDVMEWALFKPGTEFGSLPNTLAVPPANCRRVDATLRPVPELPPGMTPGNAKPPVTTVNEPVTPPAQ